MMLWCSNALPCLHTVSSKPRSFRKTSQSKIKTQMTSRSWYHQSERLILTRRLSSPRGASFTPALSFVTTTHTFILRATWIKADEHVSCCLFWSVSKMKSWLLCTLCMFCDLHKVLCKLYNSCRHWWRTMKLRPDGKSLCHQRFLKIPHKFLLFTNILLSVQQAHKVRMCLKYTESIHNQWYYWSYYDQLYYYYVTYTPVFISERLDAH